MSLRTIVSERCVKNPASTEPLKRKYAEESSHWKKRFCAGRKEKMSKSSVHKATNFQM